MLVALPMQYNAATRQATLYDSLTYRISYRAPNTVTVQGLTVNGGTPVPLGMAAVPVSLQLRSAVPMTGTLMWAVEDGAALTVAGDRAALDLTAGASTVSWSMNAANWSPGRLHLWVSVWDAAGRTIATGWTDFTVAGNWLAARPSQDAFTEMHSAAEVRAVVRDQTGAGVAGQAGNLRLWLDGRSVSATWQAGSDGLYTATTPLAGLPVGGHAFSVTLAGLVDSNSFQVDRAAPTSHALLTTTGVTTSTWVFFEWSDDATGVASVNVAYRVDGGAWRPWRTFSPGYISGQGAFFGPTEPVAVDLTRHTYCFRSQATDGAGHVEPRHAQPDVCTTHRLFLPMVVKK
jgi:hypothetical protein